MSQTTTQAESAIEQLRDEGWCRLRGLIGRDRATQTRYELHRIGMTCGVIAQGYNSNLIPIPYYTRVSILKDTQSFAEYLVDPRVDAIVNAMLGPQVCVTATTALMEEPGKQRGEWHTGEPFDAPSTAGSNHLTAIFFYSLFDEENGGLCISPRSHRGKPETLSEMTISGDLGDAILLDSRLWRRVAPNDGDLTRLSIVTGFATAPAHAERPRDPKSILATSVFDRLPEAVKPLVRHWVN